MSCQFLGGRPEYLPPNALLFSMSGGKCYDNFMKNELIIVDLQTRVPAAITAAGEPARKRFIEFFTANIRNRTYTLPGARLGRSGINRGGHQLDEPGAQARLRRRGSGFPSSTKMPRLRLTTSSSAARG